MTTTPMVIIDEGPKLPNGNFYNWIKTQVKAGLLNIHFSLCRETYVSDAINTSTIKSWKPHIPVIISAQTGTGKNTFILETLLPYIKEQKSREEHILILCNRIALNRQIKLIYQRILESTPAGLNKLQSMKRNYTQEGMDNLFIDFGPFTICTYHQLLEKKLLDNQSYTYIICDEFHFFTSDAIFNDKTDKILSEIVNKGFNATRIYMSATPEVAVEAVMRLEFNRVERMRSKLLNDPGFLIKVANEAVTWNIPMDTPEYEARIAKFKENYLSQHTTYSKCELFYYHFNRDYNYIDEIFSYESLKDLIPLIKDSSDKWLIFVSTENDGSNLSSDLGNNREDCIVLSRKIIDSSKSLDHNEENDAQYVYREIVEKEKYSQRILITTALLDNGINIKDEQVSNIVIDKFDRVEFIQMLGRIRVNEGKKIKLYIHNYPKEELIKNVNKTTKDIVEMTYNDLLSIEKRKNYFSFDKHLRFAEDEQFSDYNPCALMSYIDTIGNMIKIIKKMDSKYYVNLGVETNAKRNELLNFYIRGNGWNFPMARSMVDIFETPDELRRRNECENNDIQHGNTHNDYSYLYDNGFIKYLYEDLIVKSLKMQYEMNLNEIISACDEPKRRALNMKELVYEKRNGLKFTMYEKADALSSVLENSAISINTNLLSTLKKQIKKYEKITSQQNKIHDSLEMQMSWIERFNEPVQSVKDLYSSQISVDMDNESVLYNKFIKDKVVTEEELERNKSGNDSYKISYLEKHGILSNSEDEIECARLLGIDKIDLRSGPIRFEYNGTRYRIFSKKANRNKDNTFYLWFVDSEE